MTRAPNAFLFFFLVCGHAVQAQAPTVSHVLPAAARPGEIVEVTFHGNHLADATSIWTSFPARAVRAPRDKRRGDDKSATFWLKVASSVQVGVGGVRVATTSGISSLRLFVVDDLPSVEENGTNGSFRDAQELALPVAVDGACGEDRFDHFRFHAAAGRRISIEVLAQRLGSRLDPVLRLLDSRSKELAYRDDDAGVGADCRLVHRFETAGAYTIELRDVSYRGGEDFRYRLRIGDFPLANVPFPLAAQEGSTSTHDILGPFVEGLPPVEVRVPANSAGRYIALGVRFPQGAGSGFVFLESSRMVELVESEDNDLPERADDIPIPSAVSGRFDKANDRDWYAFRVAQGQRLVLAGRTRELGSPSDLVLRLYTENGTLLEEAEDSGVLDGRLEHPFREAGTYRLMVEDLLRRGGPQHAYRIGIRPSIPGFALEVETEKFDVPKGGVFVTKVTCKRSGYDGPITLSVEGAGDGLVLANDTIPKGKSATNLRVRIPSALDTGSFRSVRIVGRAESDGEGEEGPDFRVIASTKPALNKLFPQTPFPPAVLDGAIGLGVGPPFPSFFALTVEPKTITLAPDANSVSFQVKCRRLAKGFKDAVRLTVEGLPEGITAKASRIEKNRGDCAVTLASTRQAAAGDHRLRIRGSATFKDQPQEVVVEEIVLRVRRPAAE